MGTNRHNPLVKELQRAVLGITCVTFAAGSVPAPVCAQELLALHLPGTRVHLSAPFTPTIIRGLTVDVNNPFAFGFLVERGDSRVLEADKKEAYQKLIKYFLAAMTIAEEKQWVNLSPYEGNRIIDTDFGKTEMGRDLLAQDYMLKQITASLLYPDEDTGKEFWRRIYQEAFEKYGTTQVPVNTFNKVWIVPETASVYETGNAVLIVDSKLKVQLEEDYLAAATNRNNQEHAPGTTVRKDPKAIATKILSEIVIPALTKEVNEGKNFANLRQIYSAIILAAWYKQALKKSFLTQIYADQNKVNGVNLENPTQAQQEVYQQYLKAFKRGVYNYIKDEQDLRTGKMVPRKYFSGGWQTGDLAQIVKTVDKAYAAKALDRTVDRTMDYATVAVVPAPLGRRQFIAGITAAALAASKSVAQNKIEENWIEHESSHIILRPHVHPSPVDFYSLDGIISTYRPGKYADKKKWYEDREFFIQNWDKIFGGYVSLSSLEIEFGGPRGKQIFEQVKEMALRRGLWKGGQREVAVTAFQKADPYRGNKTLQALMKRGILKRVYSSYDRGNYVFLADASARRPTEIQEGDKLDALWQILKTPLAEEGFLESITQDFEDDLSRAFPGEYQRLIRYVKYGALRDYETDLKLARAFADNASDGNIVFALEDPDYNFELRMADIKVLDKRIAEVFSALGLTGRYNADKIMRFFLDPSEYLISNPVYQNKYSHLKIVGVDDVSAYQRAVDVHAEMLASGRRLRNHLAQNYPGKTEDIGSLFSSQMSKAWEISEQRFLTEEEIAHLSAAFDDPFIRREARGHLLLIDKFRQTMLDRDEKMVENLTALARKGLRVFFLVGVKHASSLRKSLKANNLNVTSMDRAMSIRAGAEKIPAKENIDNVGGIDLGAANLYLRIKRDGQGVPLPLSNQDPAMLNANGFIPLIVEIKPAEGLHLFPELKAFAAEHTVR